MIDMSQIIMKDQEVNLKNIKKIDQGFNEIF